MILVVLLIVYIAIASALVFGFTLVEEKMGNTFCAWNTDPERALVCAIFWPVCALPYVAYAAAIYYSSPRIRK